MTDEAPDVTMQLYHCNVCVRLSMLDGNGGHRPHRPGSGYSLMMMTTMLIISVQKAVDLIVVMQRGGDLSARMHSVYLGLCSATWTSSEKLATFYCKHLS